MIPSNLLTSPSTHDSLSFISMEGVDKMKGGVYRHRNGWRVYFKGDWFTRDEHGRPFKAEFYARSFLDLLNALYDPDPAKNRYDRRRFKDRTHYRFDEAFPLYLDQKDSDSSWHDAKKYIFQNHLSPFFINQDFRTIDKVQLEGLKKALEQKHLAGKTIKNIMMALHGFLNHYSSSLNIFPTFPDLSYQRPKIRWFTEKEMDQVFEFIREEDKGYFWAIRGYGLRPEEASGLLKDALNWETKEIIISTVFVDGKMKARTKTKTERMIPMEICPEAMQCLRQSGDSIFVFSFKGQPYGKNMRVRRWRKAMGEAEEKYGTRTMTLRDLRHSAATHWRLRKVPLDIIQKLLGHSTQEMTDQYYADVDLHQVVNMVKR
jgi:integrase